MSTETTKEVGGEPFGCSPPWGWSASGWYRYRTNDLAVVCKRTSTHSREEHDAADAWCVFIALLSIAAMALMHGAISEDGGRCDE